MPEDADQDILLSPGVSRCRGCRAMSGGVEAVLRHSGPRTQVQRSQDTGPQRSQDTGSAVPGHRSSGPRTQVLRSDIICQARGAELGFGLANSFWQSFRRLFFLCSSKSFWGALQGRSRTADLGFKEILRRIYFKVCMFGFDSSTPCLLLSGSNLDASLTPLSKAALPDTDPTARQPPLNARVARSPLGELRA